MTLFATAGPAGAVLAALCAVLALVWLAGQAARLRGYARPAGGARSLRVAEQLPLDARRRLVIVACDGRRALLLTGGPADLVVGWLPADAADGPAA